MSSYLQRLLDARELVRPHRLDQGRSAVAILNDAEAEEHVPGVQDRLADQREDLGISVLLAGPMVVLRSVLLAEADVPYELLFEMDHINDDFQNTDVVVVVGANDVTTPAARHKKSSPLYGMPILNAAQARHIIVLKRSMGAGFAGEDNELFYNPKTMMVLGDAKQTLTHIVQHLKK